MAFRGKQSTNLRGKDVGSNHPLPILEKESSLPTDVGWLGKIGSITYAGFVRDHETNTFLLIDSVELTPQSLNSINASAITKGSITVGTLTADTLVAGNLPTQYTDADARASISATGSLSYDSSTGVISFTDTDSSYANKVGYNLADETDTTSIVLNPGDASTPATFRGDVINNTGTVIVDVSSTSTTFTGGLVGDVEVTTTFVLPKGLAVGRPSPAVEGMMWFNTTTKMFEGYNGTNWVQLIPSTYQLIP